MPNLNTFSTLNERVKKSCTDYGLEDNSTAFMWLALEAILQLNTDDIEDALTDGPQDGGIDAIHIAGLYTHDKFFKETQTNRLIHEAIEAAYPTATARLSES